MAAMKQIFSIIAMLFGALTLVGCGVGTCELEEKCKDADILKCIKELDNSDDECDKDGADCEDAQNVLCCFQSCCDEKDAGDKEWSKTTAKSKKDGDKDCGCTLVDPCA